MKKSNIALFTVTAICSLMVTSPAYAYLDPGTGSMLLQLMLGGVAGALVIGKLYFQKLTDLFRRNGSSDQSDYTETQDEVD